MADTIFSADQIIGKTLFAKTVVNVRKLPDVTSEILSKTKPGQNVGRVYSYVERDSKIWWQLESEKGAWVQHNAGWFSIKVLKDQGAKTVKEVVKQKQQEEKSFTDKLGDFLGPTGSVMKYALPVGILLFGFMVADRFFPRK